MTFHASVDFLADARLTLREALIDPAATNACRLIHGAADGWPGWYVDRLGEFLLSQSEKPLTDKQEGCLQTLLLRCSPFTIHQAPTTNALMRGAYHKILSHQLGQSVVVKASPQKVLGEKAPGCFLSRENGLQFELSFREGYSIGLFLDQRDNRRRFLVNQVAADFPLYGRSPSEAEVLNTFAYTCGFSVAAAKAGARTTSVDLSRKYLEWGKRNFALNQIDLQNHDFIYGDVFDWLRRLARKQRTFDVIVLDPPTFSQSKERGVFSVERDYGQLVSASLPLLKPRGVLLACTNAARLRPERFWEMVKEFSRAARRQILQRHYVAQPPDFPISRAEPACLKTVWMRLD
jgi:23S rRNA (cytosine1962-C5)-methyltransferase